MHGVLTQCTKTETGQALEEEMEKRALPSAQAQKLHMQPNTAGKPPSKWDPWNYSLTPDCRDQF